MALPGPGGGGGSGAAAAAAALPQPPVTPSPSSEHEPLIPRSPDAPLLARCLLRPSARTLKAVLCFCFLVHLFREGRLEAWFASVLLTLHADCFWVLMALGYFALMSVTGFFLLTGWRSMPVNVAVAFLFLSLLVLAILWFALFWFALLQICLLHGLIIRCSLKALCTCLAKFCTYGQLGTPKIAFWAWWAWVPLGAALVVARVLWRPWYVLFHVLFSGGIVLHGPVMEMSWWQWREALVGGVFWSCMLFVCLAASSRIFLSAEAADRRFLLLVGTAFGIFCTLLTFYLTAPPLASFWAFLAGPWLEMAWSLARGKAPMMSVEEGAAVVAMLWGLARMLYIGAIAQMGRWGARQRMEETLRDALAHPYRAELEQGFGLMNGESGSLSRAWSRLGNSSGPPSAERSSGRSLRDKHLALIGARKQLLLRQVGGKAALPSNLRLAISRERILEDTVAALFDRPVSELLAPRVLVHFENEPGVDGGGLTRDWFDSVGRALAEHAQRPGGASLLATAPDQTLIPRPVGSDYGDVSLEQQEQFRALLALGRFMALAVFHAHPLPVSFSLILCKYLSRVPVGMSDVRQLDPEFYNGRVAQVLKADGLAETVAALGEPLTFVSAASEVCPVPEELKPGGTDMVVTEENKTEYVQLLCEAYLCGGIRREIQCLLQGFWDVLPPEVLLQSDISPRELSVLMSGVADLDPKEWKRHSSGNENTQIHTWFWELVQELDPEQRCMLLHFATGSSRLPPGGFPDLRPPFMVKVSDSGSSMHLPHAHTCANQIVLHLYTSKEQMRAKLLHALLTEDFGFC